MSTSRRTRILDLAARQLATALDHADAGDLRRARRYTANARRALDAARTAPSTRRTPVRRADLAVVFQPPAL